jgi:hypothetical protein
VCAYFRDEPARAEVKVQALKKKAEKAEGDAKAKIE